MVTNMDEDEDTIPSLPPWPTPGPPWEPKLNNNNKGN